ncbi:unnamed protein product [marine sediment metagenome]|uniref:Guanylate cyclase domain-containing protein n=1 Tax=marine sediment metagenome TaxID=412755 RepID=X1EPE7_9ZZZZ
MLLKELHWGFLKEIDKARYTKLWKELVLAHKNFTHAGDLKRNISISNIYISMLDIHGYTQFCQESKGNLSRLRKLDEFLHAGIKRIAGINGTLANLERGDEIVVIAATATDSIKIDIIFNEQYKTAYYNSKKNINTYKKLKNLAIKSEAINKKKIIWNVLIEENRDQLDLEIYSGKK